MYPLPHCSSFDRVILVSFTIAGIISEYIKISRRGHEKNWEVFEDNILPLHSSKHDHASVI